MDLRPTPTESLAVTLLLHPCWSWLAHTDMTDQQNIPERSLPTEGIWLCLLDKELLLFTIIFIICSYNVSVFLEHAPFLQAFRDSCRRILAICP